MQWLEEIEILNKKYEGFIIWMDTVELSLQECSGELIKVEKLKLYHFQEHREREISEIFWNITRGMLCSR